MRKKNPCEGCFYWRGGDAWGKMCYYLFITNHRRPCPPGAECTVRLAKSKRGRPRKVKKEADTSA